MSRLLRAITRGALRPVLSPRWSIPMQRRLVDLLSGVALAPRGVERDAESLGAIPTLRLTPKERRIGTATLYLHGGGFVLGGARSHGDFGAWLATALRSETWLPEYRLLPEHPWPAALEDALHAWRALAGRADVERLLLVGDSAGASLALALTLALRDDPSLPAPAALLLLSPWTDPRLGGASLATRAAADPLLDRAWLALCADTLRGGGDFDPLLRPLEAELAGLPPLLIQYGADEILADDATRLAERARAAGVAVTIREYPGMWHNFQALAGRLPDADRALAEIAAFAAGV
jgi:acetyl esterase/lipase